MADAIYKTRQQIIDELRLEVERLRVRAETAERVVAQYRTRALAAEQKQAHYHSLLIGKGWYS